MTPAFQYRVRVVRERLGVFGPALCCSGDIAAIAAPHLARLDREHVWALHLDPKSRLVSREVVSVGHLTSALVNPREVFKAAIPRARAAGATRA